MKEPYYHEAISLWKIYSRPYNELLRNYAAFYDECDKKHICPRRTDKDQLVSMPDIQFLLIETEDEAKKAFRELDEVNQVLLINKIKRLKNDFFYRSLRASYCEMKYSLNMYGKPKTPYGLDPDRNKNSIARATKRYRVDD